MPNKPDEFKPFTPFSYIEMNCFLNKFYKYYQVVIAQAGINEADVQFNREILMEIINRIEKRRVYFKIFYDCKMSELNEISLFCFWITKLKPFTEKGSQSMINEKIALWYFFHRVDKTATSLGKKIIITSRMVKVLSYDLRYRDISKEALMTLAEFLLEGKA